jgi:hypothetical protein
MAEILFVPNVIKNWLIVSEVERRTHRKHNDFIIQSTTSNPISLRSSLILSSHLRLRLPSGLFPLGFTTKTLEAFHVIRECYMPRLLHPPWLDHPTNTWWSVQVTKLLSLFQPAANSSHLGPNILLSILFSNTINLCIHLSVRDKVSHP